jgi:hypothetical protein
MLYDHLDHLEVQRLRELGNARGNVVSARMGADLVHEGMQ